MYEYNVLEVISVYDGDTCKLILDLGFNIHSLQTIRLKGINAPELRGKERKYGLISRDWLRNKLKDKKLIVKTYKDSRGKYGRLIAEIYVKDSNVSLNEQMVLEGFATLY